MGQEAAERTVLDAWNAGRMPHAWLITGPRGVGKATLAYRIARFVLAEGGKGAAEPGLFGDALPAAPPQTLAVAPDHPVVARIASGGHADLRVLERNMPHPVHGRPTREIVVGHVRKALQVANLTAAEAGWRVVLIDPADALNANAQNAILKNLEEPPPGVLFLLVSHAPGRLLPTIRSRCRRIALEALSPEAVDTLLARYRPEIAADDRRALARLTEGSVGDAMALADSGGLELYRTVIRLLGTLESPDIQGIHALGDSIALNGACMTVTTLDSAASRFTVDISAESLARTVGLSDPGPVNLEKALQANERLGGHLVSGHVDGVGRVASFEPVGESWRLRVRAPKELARFLASNARPAKTSIASTTNPITTAATRTMVPVTPNGV